MTAKGHQAQDEQSVHGLACQQGHVAQPRCGVGLHELGKQAQQRRRQCQKHSEGGGEQKPEGDRNGDAGCRKCEVSLYRVGDLLEARVPIYEFQCESCGHRFEKLMRISAEPPACPDCAHAQCKKLVSSSGFILKGGGWYKDHYGLKSSASSDSGGSGGGE